MTFHCGGRAESHFQSEEKLYGTTPFFHCESDCPHRVGSCLEFCANLSMLDRPCLYLMNKIGSEDVARAIINETEDVSETGHELEEKQRAKYEFAKLFLSEIQKRRKSSQ
jgi:hypothetical protein